MNRKILWSIVSVVATTYILAGCSSAPVLREEIKKIKKTHLIGAYVAGPSSYQVSLSDEQARSVQASIELRCKEGEPVPKRYTWNVPGTCEGCGMEFQANLTPIKQKAKDRFERSLRSTDRFASEKETLSLEGVNALQKKMQSLLSPDQNISQADVVDGSILDQITTSPEMAKLILENPEEAFVVALIHLQPQTSGQPFLKTKHHRFDACEYVLKSNPVQNGIAFHMTGNIDMRFAKRPDENLFVKDMEMVVQQGGPVLATIPARSHSSLDINWLDVEASEDPRFSTDSVFTVNMGKYRTDRAQSGLESSFEKEFKQSTDGISSALVRYIDNEMSEANKLPK